MSGGHLCEAEAPTEPAGETQSGCGNPFLFLRELRILSRFALRMTSGLVSANTVGCTENCRPVIAVRVSGGHLCEAEAPTEPAGETAARRAAIRTPLSLRGALAPWQSVFLFKKIKSFCARAARAPYFCTDRNREKSRRTPFQLGFRTFPNDQRDKLPFGNLYCIEMRCMIINSISRKS
mgnify:CR=1 FL=1